MNQPMQELMPQTIAARPEADPTAALPR
jgi:hypothetical protein